MSAFIFFKLEQHFEDGTIKRIRSNAFVFYIGERCRNVTMYINLVYKKNSITKFKYNHVDPNVTLL